MTEDTTNPGIVTPLMIYQQVVNHRRDTGKQLAIIDHRLNGVEKKVDEHLVVHKTANGVKKEGREKLVANIRLATFALAALTAACGAVWLIARLV